MIKPSRCLINLKFFVILSVIFLLIVTIAALSRQQKPNPDSSQTVQRDSVTLLNSDSIQPVLPDSISPIIAPDSIKPRGLDSLKTTRRPPSILQKKIELERKPLPAKKFGRYVANKAFKIGENLKFRIRYGPVVAGSSRMGVDDTVRVQGNLCYKIVTEAFSNKFFSVFFKVEDQVISYIDQQGLFTWYFEQHIREGGYKADRWAKYDQRANLVYTHKKDTLEVPPYVNDVLSSFYYVRTQKLEVGDTLFIQNHSDKKVYPMAVLVHGREKIQVKAGKFRCLIVEPIVMEAGLFKQEGQLTVWFTDDEKKIPVQMKSKVSFLGSITAELMEIKGVDKKALAKW